MYIADSNNNRIRMVNASSGIITTVAGNGASGYLGDGGNATSAELWWPSAVAIDASNNFYVADYSNCVIRFISSGIISTVAGSGACGYAGDGGQGTSAELNDPNGLALDNSNHLYIADLANNRIRMLNVSTGIISTVAGNGALGHSGDNGPATSAKLDEPDGGITVDAQGNLYFTEYLGNYVRMVNPANGIITTIAGNGTQGFNGPGTTLANTQFSVPNGVLVDSSGNLYISDWMQELIWKAAVP